MRSRSYQSLAHIIRSARSGVARNENALVKCKGFDMKTAVERTHGRT